MFTEIEAAPFSEAVEPDVLAYWVELEPNFSDRSVKGKEVIRFWAPEGTRDIHFDSGDLTVTQVEGARVEGFRQSKQQTIVSLKAGGPEIQEIELWYQGTPKQGLVFPKNQQLYTLYFTNQWMVCNFSPADKATIELDLILPEGLDCVGSGELDKVVEQGNQVRHSWKQTYETPAYTFGFAVGDFERQERLQGSIRMVFYTDHYSTEEMEAIFEGSGEMMAFFEEVSGIPYPQASYTQVLIGSHYQEMSGFAVLRDSYGDHLLNDSTENHLLSHELAHQWWGNRITCESWRHFWLNEGFATFMSAAFNERYFGKAQYQKDIATYRGVYEAIQKKGADKPLVFPHWNNPSGDDRNLVYFKGAYVLHLLREELGEKAFWQGINSYSQTYLCQAVNTQDFQLAMEKVAGRSLQDFFDRWVYGS